VICRAKRKNRKSTKIRALQERACGKEDERGSRGASSQAKESIDGSLQVEPKDANKKVPEGSTKVFITLFLYSILILLYFEI
jgi:hypothetical protein